jgi:nicotinate phosphoribosyltransferase
MKIENRQLAEGALFTDLYQLTMAQLYFRMGIHECTSQFEYFFRSNPDYGMHQAGYCISAGLECLLDWMQSAIFGKEEITALKTVQDRKGKPLFSIDFLKWLQNKPLTYGISMKAIPEGRVVHPYVPLATVEGNLAMAQILESPLLNQLNYQTLIATKAARIHEVAQGKTVLEFGLRRAQDRAATAGARAALIGGADASSNTGASLALGFQPSGTHGHSMVQAITSLGGSELEAFRAFAELYPNNCVLLVDTYNTLESGIPNAIRVFEEMKRKGFTPLGIRLDSGDLAYLSIQAAKMLNDAGFSEAQIVLSNQMDELTIWQIITQIQSESARYGVEPQQLINRLAYGIGTRLITSSGASALDGVYKLVTVRDKGKWIPTMKISESPEKTLNPGNKSTWRIYDQSGKAISDLIGLVEENPASLNSLQLYHPTDQTKSRLLNRDQVSEVEPLNQEILQDGKVTYLFPSIEDIRKVRQKDTDLLYPGVKRLINPHIYHVSLSQKLWELKQDLMRKTKGDF